MASVMGLMEEREAAARVRVEGLQAEAERILAELGAAEAVLERRVIAKAELAEALAGPADVADVAAQEVPDPVSAAKAVKVPGVGSVVPHFREGMTTEVLAPDYRRIIEVLQAEAGGSDAVSAKQIAAGLGLELVPAKVEGVRSKARRLGERGWLSVSPSGRFMPRQPTATAPAAPGKPGWPGGGP
ncbi:MULTISPECIES: hypothetical protein [unclassified Streptomyces]|uniref:hypothetical protein n=1 Tax=unclassified Streptomyces TaxID=2593676 RepID=UPI002E2F8A77|nr:hypothetical protein [Streptomyces sp. NBC_01361]